jgi:ribosome-binding factor A
MNERRIARMQEAIKERVAEIVGHELADPRCGLITITRVKLDKDLAHCRVFWSVVGDDKTRRRNQEMLDHAARHVQHELGEILTVRSVPRVQFLYDESIAGAVRVNDLLRKLREQRGPEPGSTPG